MDETQAAETFVPVRQRIVAFVKGGMHVLADAFGSADPAPPGDPPTSLPTNGQPFAQKPCCQ
eukprot:3654916-Prorocentrum_lima.AAC.1